MNCEQYELPIALYVEGDLTALEAIQIEAHLTTCAVCRSFANELRASQAAFRTTSLDNFSETMLADLRHSVMQKIADREAKLSFWQRWFRPLRWQYVTAGIVALCAVSLLFWQLKSDSRTTATDNRMVNVTPPDNTNEKILVSDDQAIPPLPRSEKVSDQKRRNPLRHHVVKEKRSGNLIAAVALPDDSPMPAPIFFDSEGATTAEMADSGIVSGDENSGSEIKLPFNDNKVRLEIQTRNPNVRIILFVDKEPRRVTDTE